MSRAGYRCFGMFFVLLVGVHWKSRSQEDTRVEHADIRGLGTTFLGSVGCLPRSRREGFLQPHNAAAGCPTPGRRLFHGRGKTVGRSGELSDTRGLWGHRVWHHPAKQRLHLNGFVLHSRRSMRPVMVCDPLAIRAIDAPDSARGTHDVFGHVAGHTLIRCRNFALGPWVTQPGARVSHASTSRGISWGVPSAATS